MSNGNLHLTQSEKVVDMIMWYLTTGVSIFLLLLLTVGEYLFRRV